MPDSNEVPPPGPWTQPAWVQPTSAQAAPPPPPPPTPVAASPFSTQAPWEQAAGFTPGARALPVGTAPLYDLRPLSTGEILDRTFSLYRKRFWLFAGLAVVASTVTTLSTFVQLTWGTVHNPTKLAAATQVDPFAIFKGPEFAVLMVTALVTAIIGFFVYSLTQAATVHAVSEVYLGRETTIRASFEKTRAHWLRYVAIAFWQGWSIAWLPLTLLLVTAALAGIAFATKTTGLYILVAIFYFVSFLSFFYGIYAYMRNSLGIVASVVEGLGVKAALIRSKGLTHHRLTRVLALFLLLTVLGFAAGVARGIPSFFLGLAFASTSAGSTALAVALEALTLVATFVTGALLLPVGAISFCLFYIDERVRREGFDVETLLGLGGMGNPARPIDDTYGGRGQATAAMSSPFTGSGLE